MLLSGSSNAGSGASRPRDADGDRGSLGGGGRAVDGLLVRAGTGERDALDGQEALVDLAEGDLNVA